jgi:YMGG-like Gly-zipper
MKLKFIAVAALTTLAAACGTTPGERAVTGGLAGAAAGAVIANNTNGHPGTGALIGGAIGAGVGAATTPRQSPTASDVNRRQYFDQRSGRYYFYDSQTNRYYYENGQPYP